MPINFTSNCVIVTAIRNFSFICTIQTNPKFDKKIPSFVVHYSYDFGSRAPFSLGVDKYHILI